MEIRGDLHISILCEQLPQVYGLSLDWEDYIEVFRNTIEIILVAACRNSWNVMIDGLYHNLTFDGPYDYIADYISLAV